MFLSPTNEQFSQPCSLCFLINMCSSQRYLASNGWILQSWFPLSTLVLSLCIRMYIRARAADCRGFIKICSMAATSSNSIERCNNICYGEIGGQQRISRFWYSRASLLQFLFLSLLCVESASNITSGTPVCDLKITIWIQLKRKLKLSVILKKAKWVKITKLLAFQHLFWKLFHTEYNLRCPYSSLRKCYIY